MVYLLISHMLLFEKHHKNVLEVLYHLHLPQAAIKIGSRHECFRWCNSSAVISACWLLQSSPRILSRHWLKTNRTVSHSEGISIEFFSIHSIRQSLRIKRLTWLSSNSWKNYLMPIASANCHNIEGELGSNQSANTSFTFFCHKLSWNMFIQVYKSCLLELTSSEDGPSSTSCFSDSPFPLHSRVDNVGDKGV